MSYLARMYEIIQSTYLDDKQFLCNQRQERHLHKQTSYRSILILMKVCPQDLIYHFQLSIDQNRWYTKLYYPHIQTV